MILDDLFIQADRTYKPRAADVFVSCAFTTNQTGVLAPPGQNISSASGGVVLKYSPRQVEAFGLEEGVFPASFTSTSPSITITSNILGTNYEVAMLGASFIAAVDDKTNIVYGAAGSVFVTISLCNILTEPPFG